MSNKLSIVDLGKISKPANTLIEKVSDAVGGIAGPWHVRRMAKAEADAAIIKAKARIEITELEERALERMVREEGQKQENIENITAKAIPNLDENASPEDVENDWITHFFDKARLTSNEEMQDLWAKILSGEANDPGSFSRRSVDLVAQLDKADAQLFTKFCTFCWMIGDLTPLIYDIEDEIYKENGIDFNALNHLDSIGLISKVSLTQYRKTNIPKKGTVFYYGRPLTIEFPEDNNSIGVGSALLTKAGQELCRISGSENSEEFFEYIMKRWIAQGYLLSVQSNIE